MIETKFWKGRFSENSRSKMRFSNIWISIIFELETIDRWMDAVAANGGSSVLEKTWRITVSNNRDHLCGKLVCRIEIEQNKRKQVKVGCALRKLRFWTRDACPMTGIYIEPWNIWSYDHTIILLPRIRDSYCCSSVTEKPDLILDAKWCAIVSIQPIG